MIPRIFIGFPILILLLFVVIAMMALFLKFFIKKPWVAAIAALVLLLLGAFIAMPQRHFVSHRVTQPMELVLPESREDTSDASAIWSPGIEDEFEADVYPSKVSAVHSLGLQMALPVQQAFGDKLSPKRIILLEDDYDNQFLREFGKAVAKVFPETPWFIQDEWTEMEPDEVWMKLEFFDIHNRSAQRQSSSGKGITNGRIEATAMAKDKSSTITARFVEKPWVEDFSGFLNNKPNDRFIIARSSESCLTESEANHQAMENACVQVAQMLERNSDRLSAVPATLLSQVNPNDILEGSFVVDRFVQSFEGTAGKIWRQALLIDASVEKLTQLAHRKAYMVRARKMSLARTVSSVVGLLLLIIVVYIFLNAATKGYYVWSLRIAGFVLALIVIFLLLT